MKITYPPGYIYAPSTEDVRKYEQENKNKQRVSVYALRKRTQQFRGKK